MLGYFATNKKQVQVENEKICWLWVQRFIFVTMSWVIVHLMALTQCEDTTWSSVSEPSHSLSDSHQFKNFYCHIHSIRGNHIMEKMKRQTVSLNY